MANLGVSAVLIAFNEAHHIGPCIDSLAACDEIVVIDLESSDETCSVAQGKGARVVRHKWVPLAQQVRKFALEQAINDWVVAIDPDMRFPEAGLERATQAIEKDDRLAVIGFPYRNLFAGKEVRYGRWGGVGRHFPTVVNRRRVRAVPVEHRGHFEILAGFRYLEIGPSEGFLMDHYWNDSWSQLKAKVIRYIPAEAEARRRDNNVTPGLVLPLIVVGRVFLDSWIRRGGALDGLRGLRFSYIAAWYEWKVLRALREDPEAA